MTQEIPISILRCLILNAVSLPLFCPPHPPSSLPRQLSHESGSAKSFFLLKEEFVNDYGGTVTLLETVLMSVDAT